MRLNFFLSDANSFVQCMSIHASATIQRGRILLHPSFNLQVDSKGKSSMECYSNFSAPVNVKESQNRFNSH